MYSRVYIRENCQNSALSSLAIIPEKFYFNEFISHFTRYNLLLTANEHKLCNITILEEIIILLGLYSTAMLPVQADWAASIHSSVNLYSPGSKNTDVTKHRRKKAYKT